MSAAKDMRKLMDELAAEMGEKVSKFTPDGKQKLTETVKSLTLAIKEHTGCNCGPDCKCGGSCGGRCGDEGCPCECGDRTGVGINECGSSIYESSGRWEGGIDTFSRAYVEAALWSSTDNSDEQGGEPLDTNYGIHDLSNETFDQMMKDSAKFQEMAGELIDNDGQAGYDFWLTRNGHGAGFWDGDWPEPAATELTNLSKQFGEFDLYVGDDGKIYGSGGMMEHDDHGGYGNAEMQASDDFHRHEMDYDDEDDFDWRSEMETGIVIYDNPRGGYSMSAEGKHVDYYDSFDDALYSATQWMDASKYWPNIFFVNDHGNVTHINTDGDEIKSIVEKETSLDKKYSKRKPYKDDSTTTYDPNDDEYPDLSNTQPDPDKIKKSRVRDTLVGKSTTHAQVGRTEKGYGQWDDSYRTFSDKDVDMKQGGKYSARKEWDKLIAEPGTVTLYKRKEPGERKPVWDVAMNGEMMQGGKALSMAAAWERRNIDGKLVFVDMINKEVKRIAPNASNLKASIEDGSYDVNFERFGDNPNNKLGFQETVDELEEQFRALLKK